MNGVPGNQEVYFGEGSRDSSFSSPEPNVSGPLHAKGIQQFRFGVLTVDYTVPGLIMTTLAEIVELDEELLHDLGLEPFIRCDPKERDNLLFLSPLILLEDLELKLGGFQERTAKGVLSRVAKHICESDDPSLFQVPEITAFHMGYAKRSKNKANKMAIDEEEAKLWLRFLNLKRFSQDQSRNPEDQEELESHGSSSSEEEVEEIPMEIDPPTAEDTPDPNLEDLVSPSKSGLKFPLQGSLILLFSILLIFFDKKKKKKSASSNDDEPKIGQNKVSDFLLFWIIPYLLNYTQQKVRVIVKHHEEVNNRHNFSSVHVWKKSSLDIIEEAMSSCGLSGELKKTIMTKYEDFYGTEQLEYEYDLLKSPENTSVILVPKRYKVTQMPAALQDIGTTWRELGDIKLIDHFVSKFIRSKKIQRDFLYSLPLLKNRQGIEYAILLPDEDTFNEVKRDLEKRSAEYLTPPKFIPKGGRNLIMPSIGLVTNTEKPLSVCFTYFQGTSISLCCFSFLDIAPYTFKPNTNRQEFRISLTYDLSVMHRSANFP